MSIKKELIKIAQKELPELIFSIKDLVTSRNIDGSKPKWVIVALTKNDYEIIRIISYSKIKETLKRYKSGEQFIILKSFNYIEII